MRLRIVKCSLPGAWWADHIGKVVEVFATDSHGHWTRDTGPHRLSQWVKPEDCEPAGRECPYCGGKCAEDDCEKVFTPIIDCEHKDPEDGCCGHPKNMTPECHVDACPRLHRRLCRD